MGDLINPEAGMKLSESLLPEFDQETANTRKTLERVPEEKFDWKPHNKSFSMLKLATHIATLPGWTAITLNQDFLDVSRPFTPPVPKTRGDLLDLFDKSAAEARSTIAATPDEVFFQPWSLKNGTATVFTMPKIAVLRSFVMNHSIHHRAQLGVYLRLNDVPVPGLYGPSADDAGM
jgi:uncharacterized damage-inducible protein DinB